MITTTLNRIRVHSPWQKMWEKLLKGIGKTIADDEPLPYATIIISNGLDDALWCCRAEPQYEKEWRLFAVACARRVENLNPDPRVKNAIDVAERYLNGKATIEELNSARGAVNFTMASTWAAKASTWAEKDDENAAWHVAKYAANSAKYAARRAVNTEKAAANTAELAAWAAAGARDAAWVAELEWQKQEFIRVVTETE